MTYFGTLEREKRETEGIFLLLGMLTMILKRGARLSKRVHPDVVWVLCI
jgi:hypothetical protein